MSIMAETADRGAFRPDMKAVLITGVIAASFFFSYSMVFRRLIWAWWNNSVYSHGFLVPLISLYLIWIRRDLLRGLLPSPSLPLGLAILASGLSILVLGHAGGISVIQEISLIITVAGIVVLLLGSAFFKALWFPIAYLAFMLRFFELITEVLHEPFQNISAQIGTALIRLTGIPAFRESIYIELPNITLEVAKVCSGVNYLIAVFVLGIPLAYITLRSWRRRLILVSGSVLIAILSNGFRVALIGVLSYHNLAGDLHGPYHMLQAMFTSFVGFTALFAGAWILSDKKAARTPVPAVADGADTITVEAGRARASWPIYMLTVLLLVAAGSYASFYTPSPVPLKAAFSLLPYTIGGWSGVDTRETPAAFREMDFDDHLSRTYGGPGGMEVKLYIGYYRIQAHGRELVNYITREMHVGSTRSTLTLDGNEPIELNMVTLRAGRRSESISFWYDINGRRAAGRLMAKAYTTLDTLAAGRSNGAVVVVSSANDGTEDRIKGSFAANMAFIRALAPRLSNHIP